MTRLRSLHPDLWVVDHPSFRVGGLALGTRTTLVRLQDGGLWLHSPGPLDDEVRDEIGALARVASIVVPSLLHHGFLAENVEAFPEARIFVPPGLREKLPELPRDEVLGDDAPPAWKGEIEQVVAGGMPKTHEVVFLHRASHTLLLTDLAFNVRQSDSWSTRLAMRLNGRYGSFGPTRVLRIAYLSDGAALRRTIDQVLAWDFDRVIVAHGDVLESGGREALREGYAWLAG
jgi:hypothetical protein